ncbi:C2H2 finger domain-containing protein [Xylaria acuta]|nr:C2H2 finger domain-containing protein [Xylaria acuta]
MFLVLQVKLAKRKHRKPHKGWQNKCNDLEELLYDGNLHPPEYYQRSTEHLDETSYDRKQYSKNTTALICVAERQWCCYLDITFKVIYNFLDWHLGQRTTVHGRRKPKVGEEEFLCYVLAIVELGDKHSLTDDKRENRSMIIADLKIQIETILNTTERSFKLGEQRILAVPFLLLLALAGARPASILQLRFRDIRVVLVRDPNYRLRRLLIKFTLKFTKRYFGPEAAKTFLIPEIIFDPSLFFSLYIFLLGILFRHRAFSADIFNDKPKIPLPLKLEIRDKLVNRIGELLGLKHTTICYSLRYMAGNNMDRNVNISQALRNLVMDHAPNFDTFQKHYLNRNVCADLWAMHRACEPQQTLVKIATSHGHSRSTRRPANLSPEQSAALNHYPNVVRLKQQLQRLHPDSPEYRLVCFKVQATKAYLRKTNKQAGFFYPINLFRTINAVIASCFIEEPLITKVLKARQPSMPIELGLDPVNKATQLRNSVLVSHVSEKKLRRCFICIGKALMLPSEDPGFRALCRTFAVSTDTARHFKSVHMSKFSPDSKVVCPVCIPIVKLKHRMHLQNHAESVHGISSPGRVTTYRHLLDNGL